jgi:hypothetical protein
MSLEKEWKIYFNKSFVLYKFGKVFTLKMNSYKLQFFLILFLSYNVLCAQQVYVYNSAGSSSVSSDFIVVSSFSEPITSISSKVENGFLFKNRHFPYKEDHFAIYPNPSSDFIFIEVGLNTDLIIYNSIGQIVLNKRLSIGLNQVYVTDFANGIYYLMLLNEELSIKGHKILKY